MNRSILAFLVVFFMYGSVFSEQYLLKYRQVSDISVENNTLEKSVDKGNLFEMDYILDTEEKTLTRIRITRLDNKIPVTDNTVYIIMKAKTLPCNDSTDFFIMAVGEPGLNNIEIIWLGTENAYSCRNSGLMGNYYISCVYKKVESMRIK